MPITDECPASILLSNVCPIVSKTRGTSRNKERLLKIRNQFSATQMSIRSGIYQSVGNRLGTYRSTDYIGEIIYKRSSKPAEVVMTTTHS